MKLIDDWRAKLNALWSVRLAILTALLAVADQLIAPFEKVVPSWAYALLSIAIIVARVVYQPKLASGDQSEPAKP